MFSGMTQSDNCKLQASTSVTEVIDTHALIKVPPTSQYHNGLTLVCAAIFSLGDPGIGAAADTEEISELIDPVLLNTSLAALSSEGPDEFDGFLDKTFFLDFVTFDDGANSPYFIAHVKYLSH
jgi:hypothetical protein